MKWRRFIPHTFLFFAGLGYAVWSFVRLPFPMLDENPLLDLVDYHTPNFYGWVVLWYYASPFVAVMLAGATSPPSVGFQRGRSHPGKRPRPSSLARSIIRSRRGRFSILPGSPFRSGACTDLAP